MTPRSHRQKLDYTKTPDYDLDISIWRSGAVNIDIGVFAGESVASLSGVTSVTMRVKENRYSTANLISKTVAAASFGSPDAPTWLNGTAQHARFELSSSDTNIDTVEQTGKRELHVVFTALNGDGNTIPLGAGMITILDDNDSTASDPSENPDAAMSPAQADARYLRWYSAVTGLTGSTAADLDSITTTTLDTLSLAVFAISGEFQVWELQAGTAAENAANGIVRPDDYNASTNAKIWVRIS